MSLSLYKLVVVDEKEREETGRLVELWEKGHRGFSALELQRLRNICLAIEWHVSAKVLGDDYQYCFSLESYDRKKIQARLSRALEKEAEEAAKQAALARKNKKHKAE